MTPASKLPLPVLMGLRSHCQQRLEALRSYRISWWAHWAQLASVYLPRRYKWFVVPNNYNRGRPMNQAIVDETGMICARTLATGLLSGLTSPTKPWMRMGLAGVNDLPEGPEKVWLSQVTQIILEIYNGSNFYEMLGQAYYDEVVFGSSPLLQYEDADQVVRFYNPCAGEYFFGLSPKLVVDTLYREYTYTIKQVVDEFGLENVSEATRLAYKTPSNLDQEVVMCHSIEPNDTVYYGGAPMARPVPSRFPWREVFWEQFSGGGNKNGYINRVAGFLERPFVGLRWDVTSNDPYGRSPGMDGLPCVLQLQVMQRRLAEAIEKQLRPPMVASNSMKNEPTDTTPGGVTYVPDIEKAGFKPAYTVTPQVREMTESIQDNRSRAQKIFFTDLFLMISNLDTVRSATEIDARNQEKIIQLGPVIERTENEGLDEIVKRTFAIANRRGLFPPAPPSIRGHPLAVRYISILAQVQRAEITSGIERIYSFGGSIAAVQPQVMDGLNSDRSLILYADAVNADPTQLNDPQVIAATRAARAQAARAQAQLSTGQAAAQGAETLSRADIGGGKNALQGLMEAA